MRLNGVKVELEVRLLFCRQRFFDQIANGIDLFNPFGLQRQISAAFYAPS
jgi:hypothetical protein